MINNFLYRFISILSNYDKFPFLSSFEQKIKASCLSYGHSCWGAHGKRSGAPTEKLIEQIPDENANSRWEIIKILQDKVRAAITPRTNIYIHFSTFPMY